jgi:hypothetical protein
MVFVIGLPVKVFESSISVANRWGRLVNADLHAPERALRGNCWNGWRVWHCRWGWSWLFGAGGAHQNCLYRLVNSATDDQVDLFNTVVNAGLDFCLDGNIKLSYAVVGQSLSPGFKFESNVQQLAIKHCCKCFLERGWVAGFVYELVKRRLEFNILVEVIIELVHGIFFDFVAEFVAERFEGII